MIENTVTFKTRFAPAVLLTLLVAAVFGNTLGHGFVWDDTIFVPGGAVYKQFDLSAIFFSLRANGLEYLPVRDLSYALDCLVWGENPLGFHLSNLLLYWLNVISVLLLATRVAALCHEKSSSETTDYSRYIGFFTAALFAVHPMHCEVVSFIACRNVLLSGLFFFLACVAYLHYLTSTESGRAGFYAAALACFLLSLFSKATGIILPLILLLFSCFFRRASSWRHWIALAPFFILSGGVFFLFTAIARINDILPQEPFCGTLSCLAEKSVVALQIPLFYLYKLVIPIGYSVDYGTGQFGETFTSVRVLAAMALLIVLAATAWLCRRKLPLVLFCAFWFLLTLIPVLHLIPTRPVIADRYAYLPSFAFCLLVAASIVRLAGKWSRSWVLSVLVLTLSLLAVRQNAVWKSEKSLWQYTLTVSPQSTTALAELGRIYFLEERNYSRAMELYQRLSDIDPGDPAIELFQGALYMMRRDAASAVTAFQRAVARNGENIEAVFKLAHALEAAGEIQRAKDYYHMVLTLKEADPRADMRGRALAALRRLGGND